MENDGPAEAGFLVQFFLRPSSSMAEQREGSAELKRRCFMEMGISLVDDVELLARVDEGICSALAENVKGVRQWIEDRHFDMVVVSGRSGFISGELLLEVGVDPNKVVKLKVDEKVSHWYRDHRFVVEEVVSMGKDPHETKVVFVDDHMEGGLKARLSLESLLRAGFADYGFAALVGPADLGFQSVGLNSEVEVIKERILRRSGLELGFAERLFFPDYKNPHLCNFIRSTAELSRNFHQMHMVGEVGADTRFAKLERFFEGLVDMVARYLH